MERELITIPKGGRPKKELSPAMVVTLQMQKATGMTIPELAKFHNVSQSTMWRWLKKAGCVYGKKES